MPPISGPVRVRVPATSANLGPGFDALGLALTLYDDLEARILPAGLSIQISGEGEARTWPARARSSWWSGPCGRRSRSPGVSPRPRAALREPDPARPGLFRVTDRPIHDAFGLFRAEEADTLPSAPPAQGT